MGGVLLTGATGFVPSNIVLALSQAGYPVLGLDQRPPEERLVKEIDAISPVRGAVDFVQGDVRDEALIERLIAERQPEYVVHAAAITPTREMEEAQPRRIVEVNEVSLISVLESSARHGVRRVVSFSSEAAYDQHNPSSTPLDEDAPLYGGERLYSLTKIAGESPVHWARAHFGLEVRVVRPGSVYGPYERPTGARQHMSAVFQAMHLALAGETLRPNAPDVVFSYVHVRDVAGRVSTVMSAAQRRRLQPVRHPGQSARDDRGSGGRRAGHPCGVGRADRPAPTSPLSTARARPSATSACRLTATGDPPTPSTAASRRTPIGCGRSEQTVLS